MADAGPAKSVDGGASGLRARVRFGGPSNCSNPTSGKVRTRRHHSS